MDVLLTKEQQELLNLRLTALGYASASFQWRHQPTEESAITASPINRPPIGAPIANTQVYILDAHLQLVPIGVAGELYIGGDGLARGYLNQPALTAERFIDNPFGPGRLYKSGDLACYRANGNLEYLGRIDHQVKLRGFRIELGEIEAVLNRHNQVQYSVVVLREDTPGDKRLVAYIVGDEGLHLDELHAYLKGQLPDYMVPSVVMPLDALPLTPNGKIDRQTLPAPTDDLNVSTAFVAPQSERQLLIANLVAAVLALPSDRIGLHDNFFDLGGHSLLAMQLITRLRQTFDVEVPLQALFESPTIAGLETTLAHGKGNSLKIPALVPVARDGTPLPLSYAQERLWFLAQLEGASTTYTIPGAVQVEGFLDVEALQQAIDALVHRHESLRTTFPTHEGVAIQQIHAMMTIPLQVVEAAQLSNPLSDWMHQVAQHPFDLATGPLLRVNLFSTDEQSHILMVTMHHIISDGWSIGVFIQELATLYNTYHQGESSEISPLPIQYADYTHWQRYWLQGEVLSTQLDYWQQQLAGAPALLELPTDHPRPAVQSFRGRTHSVTLPLKLTQQVKATSQRHNVTLFMTLLAAFQVLLSRYSRQPDVVVGTPIANRQQPELEGLIGCFVNTLVMRTQIDEQATVTQLLQQVRRISLGAFDHQDVPFEQVVEALQPQRTLAHSPVFQVMFVLQNAPMPALELADVTLSPLEIAREAAQFDLTLAMRESEAGLVVSWSYNRELFESQTIERMTGHFETLLTAMVTDASQAVATLPLLTPAEQEQLLTEWNNTAVDYPLHQCLHEWFEQQVERTPEAIAVVYEQQQLTYGELNQRANQLARHLQSLGVGPDGLVGICVERSLEMVVGVLGILKAGGAYVPLDPSYPAGRLEFMLNDAQVGVLLSQQRLLEQLPSSEARVVCLDRDWLTIAQESAENLNATVTPENLAYVIYTSGSTGTPKGVLTGHRAICNRLLWMQGSYPLTPDERILQKTPFSFDVSVWEFFWPLWVGATLVVAKPGGHKDSRYLIELMVRHRITTVHFVPSMLATLLQDPQAHTLTDLKRVLCGGETLSIQLQADIFDLLQCDLHNLYGPTEAAIDVTAWPCQMGQPENGSVPIGRPIANTQLYILDPQLQPLPIGVPGELHIGGIGVAKGYLNRPELTAERFIPNPFLQAHRPSTTPSSPPAPPLPISHAPTLYKTGDLARYRPDGAIEYLGRIDHQVKLRGFRIELGEIETVLTQHPHVRQCVVMAREDNPGNQRLVAYVVTDGDCDEIVLKAHLKQHLPDYMVPSVTMFLPSLPLNPNGKIDRKALPTPTANLRTSSEFIAPQGEVQNQLVEVFAQVLSLPITQIGMCDSFFELGGHSLLATQAIARIRQTFQVDIPVRQLFETPTIAELDQWLANQQPSMLHTAPIMPMPREHPIPLSFAQERLWFVDQLNPGNVAYNQSSAVRLTGKLDVTALHQSLQAIVERHEILRTTFPLLQGQPIQQIASALEVVLPIVDLQPLSTTQQSEEVKRLAIAANQQPFDLVAGPLFRASILRLGAETHVLLWATHHIISDIWSTGVLVHELAALYTAHVTSSPASLEPLPIQYADFALWQRQWLIGEVLEQQLAYWRQQLGGKLPVLRLPTDYPPPSQPSFRGTTVTFQLSANLASKLQALSQAAGATLFMTLLASFKALLYAYTGQPDMIVGTDIANRNRTEIEGLIGFFVNLLVLRTDLSGNPSFRDLLQRVRDVALAGYAHQDSPFAQLVQTLQTDAYAEAQRRVGATPLFQVLFVMQNAPFPPLMLPELTLTPLNLDMGSAKFDLALFLHEAPEGITVTWNYSTDRFAADTISRMAQQFETLLQQAVDQPDTQLETLVAGVNPPQSGSKSTKRRKKFKRVAPHSVQHSANDMVSIQPLPCGVLTIQPNRADVDLGGWATGQRTVLHQKLLQHGALLFRGFSIPTAREFEQAAEAISPDLFGEYGDLPRAGVSGKVYGSTPYPEDKAILFHNESSHLQQWPMKIWFCCLQPAQQGGVTPIVDCRRVYQALSPEVRDRLAQKQLMYVRNYIKGLDVNWQDFFHTTDRSVVERRCQAAAVDWEWLADDGLQTRQVRPAIARHPHTRDWVVFNQLQLHHLSYLDAPTQASLLSLFGADRLPRQVYYGDGSPIEPAVLEALQIAYTQAEQVFTWQQGDILMLDNMLMAHGRQPYVGPRRIAVAMGEIMAQAQLGMPETPSDLKT
ncbi:MAG: amino acid adenylation domain-containing protein [Cyanobacteria bacterium J06635_15]